MTSPEVLRLLVIPVFAWIAWRDYRTRRIPDRVWLPLVIIGILLLVWEGWNAYTTGSFEFSRFVLLVTISIGFLVPLAYAFYWIGGFGGADAKAFIVIAILFPTFPEYTVGTTTLPMSHPDLPVLSLTIILNSVLVGALYPLMLLVRNTVTRSFSPVMVVGRPVHWTAIETTHGKLLESPDGYHLSALDLDALRMYLRWRGATLEELRENPTTYKDPDSLPESPHPPTDGAVHQHLISDGGKSTDQWGAERFLASIEHSAYGSTPEKLRSCLELVTTRDTVWISPGIPFIVPLFIGMLIAVTYGDIFYQLLNAVTGM